MTPAEIIASARKCLDTPFRHQGRIVGRGLDCAGVLDFVATDHGCQVIDVQGYARTPHAGLLESALDAQPYLVAVRDRKPGDVLLMRFAREPQHIAIFTGETIIHSYEAVGKCCEHDLTPEWARRIVRVYRFTRGES